MQLEDYEKRFVKKIEEMSDDEIRLCQKEMLEAPMPEIRTLDFLAHEAAEVTYDYQELTAVCPMTGLQDIYNIRISYVPGKKVPELKSLKMYFHAYRNMPILHEHLACKIFMDFKKAVEPARFNMELESAVRGGIRSLVHLNLKTPE